VRSTRRKKNCITNIIIIEVDDACKLLCKCQGTKAAHRPYVCCVDGYFELPSTPTRTLQIHAHVACLNKWTRSHTSDSDRMETQRELGNADRTGTPRSTCGSVLRGTDPMADGEPRHCFFPSYTRGGDL
jgi:hypothetical protein